MTFVQRPTVEYGAYQIANFEAGPLGIGLMQHGDAVEVGSVDSGSAAKAQGVQIGCIVLEVGGASAKGKNKQEVIAMVAAASRPLKVKFGSPADTKTARDTGKIQPNTPSALARARSRSGSAQGMRRAVVATEYKHPDANSLEGARREGKQQAGTGWKPLSDFQKTHLPPVSEPPPLESGFPSSSTQPAIDRKLSFKKHRVWNRAESSSEMAANALARLASRHPLTATSSGAVATEADELVANEVEAELKDLRTKLASKTPMPPIVRRGQTVKQFLDDSKKAAEEGMGV